MKLINTLGRDEQQHMLSLFSHAVENHHPLDLSPGGLDLTSPLWHARGAWTVTAAALNDLYRHIIRPESRGWRFGYHWAAEIVPAALRRIEASPTLRLVVGGDLQGNFDHAVELGNYDGSFKLWREEFTQAAADFAKKSADLPTFNAAQWSARAAVVALGELSFERTAHHLKELKGYLADWEHYAGVVDLGANGAPRPYSPSDFAVEADLRKAHRIIEALYRAVDLGAEHALAPTLRSLQLKHTQAWDLVLEGAKSGMLPDAVAALVRRSDFRTR